MHESKESLDFVKITGLSGIFCILSVQAWMPVLVMMWLRQSILSE